MIMKKYLLPFILLACIQSPCICAELYTVIISGGRGKLFNHERYWNDCAFFYRTLRQTYHLPQDYITLLMADGDDPAPDMLRNGAAGFISSPTDLDGDGKADLHLAATRENLEATFSQLSHRLTANDHLFIFVIDHGERSDDDEAFLWLWDNGQLRPWELATMVNQCHPATMNILLGQCHAGAFVGPLQGEGRIITTACSDDEMSWSCLDRPYDEFVYHWICAVAQHDELGNRVVSDFDNDGRVTMAEAFEYAMQHDRRSETPIITAQPWQIASEWSFGNFLRDDGISIVATSSDLSPRYHLSGRRSTASETGLYIENGQLKFKR